MLDPSHAGARWVKSSTERDTLPAKLGRSEEGGGHEVGLEVPGRPFSPLPPIGPTPSKFDVRRAGVPWSLDPLSCKRED